MKVEELTINYEENGTLKVKQLDKVILSKGAWATVLYKYQDWSARAQEYGPIKFTIRRYQKRKDIYYQQSKFNISSLEQGRKIVEALTDWLGQEAK